MLLLVATCALVAAGCTVPGSGRLQGPPGGLPASLELVTADVLGYSLYDTDPRSKLWAGLGEGTADDLLVALHAGLAGGFDADLGDIQPWIGDAAGTAHRELDLDGTTDTSTLYFADVSNRDRLEAFLEDAGWSREPSSELGGPGEDATLWTHHATCDDTPSGTQGICAAPEHVAYEAAAVTDDAIVAARSTAALKSLLRAAGEYAVPERKAMSELTVEAANRVPVAFVFRSDLLRTQVRRPFEHDPALLEFARWATDSNVLVALRDGWIGLAPSADDHAREGSVRVVGTAEWVPDLASGITLGAAKPDMLSHVGPGADVAVALNDPGQHLRELVRAITFGAGQYVTEQDVPEGEDRVELLPLLDRLDGDAAIGYDDGELRVASHVDEDASAEVIAALDHAGVDATASESDDGTTLFTVPIRQSLTPSGVMPDTTIAEPSGSSPGPVTAADFAAAGTPPRAPFAWFRTSASERGCIGGTSGWLTFDGTDRITLGMHVELVGGREIGDPVSRIGNCRAELVARH